MDNVTLKKKLSSFVSEKGYVKNVSDDVLYELLISWENWTGNGKDFYRSLGLSKGQMSPIIGKAKKLKRDGYFGDGDFKQIKVDGLPTDAAANPCEGMEVVWKDGRLIRFAQVDHLIDFLKKAA